MFSAATLFCATQTSAVLLPYNKVLSCCCTTVCCSAAVQWSAVQSRLLPQVVWQARHLLCKDVALLVPPCFPLDAKRNQPAPAGRPAGTCFPHLTCPTPALLPLHSALQDAKRNALRANGLCWLACGGMHLYNAGAGVQVRSAAFSNARLATNGLLPLVARHAGGSAGRAVPRSTSQQPPRTKTL